jgi:hypothetical protein
VLYGLLELLDYEPDDRHVNRQAHRIAEALTHAYDDRVEAALMKMLEGRSSYAGEGAITTLLAHASGEALDRAVDLAVHHSPYVHSFYQASQIRRPELALRFAPHLEDQDPRVRKVAREMVDRFEKMAAADGDTGEGGRRRSKEIKGEDDPSWRPGRISPADLRRLEVTKLYPIEQIWERLARPSQTGSAIRGLRELLTHAADSLSIESLQAICSLRDTYLYCYEYFPAGYEYDPFFEIEALSVEDCIEMARGELEGR